METLVEIKNLKVSYDQHPVLKGISFAICRGELVSLIGLNGSGKSTLLRAIVGLITPDSGEVVRHTESIFFVPQHRDLDLTFPLTVEEFCGLFGRADSVQFLEKVGVKGLLRRQVGSLSGGEFQRVVIALALSHTPDLLLLDEPTSGIDLVGENSFYALIDMIRREYGTSIVLVSHDIHLVVRHADKVLCLANALCCHGTPQEVQESESFQELFGPYLRPYKHDHDH